MRNRVGISSSALKSDISVVNLEDFDSKFMLTSFVKKSIRRNVKSPIPMTSQKSFALNGGSVEKHRLFADDA